jgi:hypothetical protein
MLFITRIALGMAGPEADPPFSGRKWSPDNYMNACNEHVFLLRCEGLSWLEIAKRFGVQAETTPRVRCHQFAIRLNRAMRLARLYWVDS